MLFRHLKHLSISALLFTLTACGGDNGNDGIFMQSASGQQGFTGEPALETDEAALDEALICTEFSNPDKPPVLLVHGTFTMGQEQYPWNYIPLLIDRGFDVCTVTYPDRGLGDQQISAEYVVHALRTIHAQTGRKVAMIGHSQGAAMPRWAIKWWASARDAVGDFVLQAGPNHGTSVSDPNPLTEPLFSTTGMPAAFYQFQTGSNFVAAVNAGDETPGDIDYTTLYTQFDELVQPVDPVPTAALDWEMDNPKVSNILLQDVCPGYFADHLTIGTTDALAFALSLDAILNKGPADVDRAGGVSELCGLLPVLPEQNIGDYTIMGFIEAFQAGGANSIPSDFHTTDSEPPLKPYAQGAVQ